MKDCPGDSDLRRLLDAPFSSGHPPLEHHLSDCPACQARLQSLAGPLPSPSNGPSDRTPRTLPVALQNAIRHLQRTPLTPLRQHSTSSPPLDFRSNIEEQVLAAIPQSDGDGPGRLSQYQPHRVIGSGGFGVVLQAEDTRLRRQVAIKVLSPALAVDRKFRERFLREARAAAAIDHPGIVTIYAIEDTDAFPYIVMELVEGESLQQRLQRCGPFAEADVLRVGRSLALALHAAHKAGVLHRDIKPSNILLPKGKPGVRVTDFGLARSDRVGRRTSADMIVGTPAFMSPEQARGEELDFRSDLFSLGSVLYAMVTGRGPFEAGDAVTTLQSLLTHSPPDVRELRPDLSPGLADVIRRLHRIEPDERFSSALQVARRLQVLRQHHAGATAAEGASQGPIAEPHGAAAGDVTKSEYA